MNLPGRNIRQRLYGLRRLPQRLSRARYFRGHGVHSPFVYSIVRQVFMQSDFISGDTFYTERVYDSLVEWGVPHKRAVQLVNLCAHCDYRNISVGSPSAAELIVAPAAVAPAEFAEYVHVARECGGTLAIISPYLDRERERACREIVASHTCTTIDNRGYLLVFNNYLPKQHFQL